VSFFFFQAEDGIRDFHVTGVQTCALPIFRVETYPTVHQMVSRVRARLNGEAGFADILAALFPCGSVTGAPKISAMKILRTLEDEIGRAACRERARTFGSLGRLRIVAKDRP